MNSRSFNRQILRVLSPCNWQQQKSVEWGIIMDPTALQTSSTPSVKLWSHTVVVVLSAFLVVWCIGLQTLPHNDPFGLCPGLLLLVLVSLTLWSSSSARVSLGSFGRAIGLFALPMSPEKLQLCDSRSGQHDHRGNYGSQSTAPAPLLAECFTNQLRERQKHESLPPAWENDCRQGGLWIRKDRTTSQYDTIFIHVYIIFLTISLRPTSI